MEAQIESGLTEPDVVVLANLFNDIQAWKDKQAASKQNKSTPAYFKQSSGDEADIKLLTSYNNKDDPGFVPTVFTTWDDKHIHPVLNQYIVKPYSRIAQKVVRHPTDVVFLSHLIVIFTTVVPSAIRLYLHFNYFHAVVHTAWAGFCMGPFTLMMHNHIHNNGILNKRFSWFDFVFPYLLEPLMGHSWDSYYYHHVKHHHVEGNNPDDLSSTVRYQRDDAYDFMCYVARFYFFIWLELPLYFLRKNKLGLAAKSALSEYGCYTFFYLMARKVDFRATLFVMLIPFGLLRFAMMVGNFGQHALVDEIEPDSDFRSSITLIDVPVSFAVLIIRTSSLTMRFRATGSVSTMATTQLTILTHDVIGANSRCISSSPRRHIAMVVLLSFTILTTTCSPLDYCAKTTCIWQSV